MFSGESLMEFVSKRVAAVREIITKVETAMVRYEEGLGGQRRLSDMSWKPQNSSHRTELIQHHVYEEKKILTDQLLFKQESTSSLDQEEPEPPLIKEEQQELCIHQQEGQFLLKQENDTLMETSPSEETDCHESEPNRNQPLCQRSTEAENQDQGGCRKENSESYSNEELTINKKELLQHHVCEKKKVLTDQLLFKQESTSNLDQEEPEPPLIEEDQQELCIHQRKGQFLLKQENVMETSPCEETNCHEPEPNRNQPMYQSSTEAENQAQGGCRKENLESNSNKELTRNKICQQNQGYSVDGQKLKWYKRTLRGERPFSCKHCGKYFSHRCYLNIHMRAHTGEKPYPCKTCGKFFSQSSHLTTHMKTHTGEKPYPCKTCGKCFSWNAVLTRHMIIHTGEKPYPCNICSKCFTGSGSLTKHMRTHTGERPYPCKTCGKCFTDSSTLTKHIRTHTGEKPFACKTCDKCFTVSSSLTKHMRTHR